MINIVIYFIVNDSYKGEAGLFGLYSTELIEHTGLTEPLGLNRGEGERVTGAPKVNGGIRRWLGVGLLITCLLRGSSVLDLR